MVGTVPQYLPILLLLSTAERDCNRKRYHCSYSSCIFSSRLCFIVVWNVWNFRHEKDLYEIEVVSTITPLKHYGSQLSWLYIGPSLDICEKEVSYSLATEASTIVKPEITVCSREFLPLWLVLQTFPQVWRQESQRTILKLDDFVADISYKIIAYKQ